MSKRFSSIYKPYLTGFIVSLLLTLMSFWLVGQGSITGAALATTIGILAISQLIVQVTFFLHLGDERKPKLHLLSFLFMIVIVMVLVLGTLWIMYHLDYNAMSSHEAGQYLLEDEGVQL
jgi:cytochrome o ubiquinol oxidase subunit IV